MLKKIIFSGIIFFVFIFGFGISIIPDNYLESNFNERDPKIISSNPIKPAQITFKEKNGTIKILILK